MGTTHNYKQKVANHLIVGKKATVDLMDHGTHEQIWQKDC